MKTFIGKISIIAFLLGALSAPVIAHAITLLPACATAGTICGLNDIVQTFINFARMILGFVGSAILFFFIYGGFIWLTSGGSSDKIKKGKDIIVNSIIGLVIVFAAFTIIQFVFLALGAEQGAQLGQECTKGGKRGVVFIVDAKTQKTDCITSCGKEEPLKSGGYDCMDPAKGTNCISGLCAKGNDNVCCQKK